MSALLKFGHGNAKLDKEIATFSIPAGLINGFKRATVVYSEEQAAALGLDIDHDDSHAYDGNESFALLLHGTQAKGTAAAKALSALKLEGKGGYSKFMRATSAQLNSTK